MAQYLEAYCDRFDLRPLVHLRHEVTSITPLDPTVRLTPWCILATSTETGSGESVEAVCEQVVVASGKEWQPRTPDIKDRARFRGCQLHSMAYVRDNMYEAKYGGQRVLIMGASASGYDIAEEVATVAKLVYIR